MQRNNKYTQMQLNTILLKYAVTLVILTVIVKKLPTDFLIKSLKLSIIEQDM